MSDTSNPVADLLAKTSAPDLVGGTLMPPAAVRPFVAHYRVGKPGSGRGSGAMVLLIIGAGLVLVSVIVAITALSASEINMNSGVGIGLLLVIAGFIVGSALFRATGGTLQWRRVAQIHSDRVEVTDTAGGTHRHLDRVHHRVHRHPPELYVAPAAGWGGEWAGSEGRVAAQP